MIAASAKIHPLAVVEDGAVIGENVVVGPFCYVGPKVVLHDEVELLPHAIATVASSDVVAALMPEK